MGTLVFFLLNAKGGCGAVEKVQIRNQGRHGQTCLAVLRRENQALPHRPAIAMRFFNSPTATYKWMGRI